jgi:hypothetical protein
VNLLILSAIPATMFFGFLTGVVGFVSSVLAFPVAFVAYVLLDYELRVVEFFSHLPFASVAVNSFPLWFAVFCYAIYFLLYLWFKQEGGAPVTAGAPPQSKPVEISTEPF